MSSSRILARKVQVFDTAEKVDKGGGYVMATIHLGMIAE